MARVVIVPHAICGGDEQLLRRGIAATRLLARLLRHLGVKGTFPVHASPEDCALRTGHVLGKALGNACEAVSVVTETVLDVPKGMIEVSCIMSLIQPYIERATTTILISHRQVIEEILRNIPQYPSKGERVAYAWPGQAVLWDTDKKTCILVGEPTRRVKNCKRR